MEPDIDEASERAHFRSVVAAFKHYKVHSLQRINKSEKIITKLPENHQRRLEKYRTYLTKFRKCVEANNSIVQLVIKDVETIFQNVDHSNNPETNGNGHMVSNYDDEGYMNGYDHKVQHDVEKVQSVLKNLVRDWSEMGAAEREQCYKPIIDEILEQFPPTECEPHSIKILVPGAGLGRLAWEVATRGYTCQGNEFSLFMLFAGNFILNKCPQVSEPHSIKILVPGAGLGRLAWEVATRGYTCQGNEFSLFMLFAGNFILNKCPQVSEPHSIKILVPGAGLGRLAWEVATRGYTCQGNEFSLFMLFAGNFILNKCPQVSEPHSIKILVPGAGLGRLAWEVATRGYTCQGNEFSLFMLFAGNFILNKCPQVSEPHSIKILVPGAGLGRLAWEVATRGYTCQGNEFSLFMLFAGNFILNKCPQVSEPHSIKILVPGAGLLRLAWEVATRGYTCQGNEFSLFMLFAGNFILNKCPQVSEPHSIKILVPGAGLGRLAWEVATRGYTCQGNEFSLFMLFAGNFILNKCPQVSEPHSIKILVPGAGLLRLAWEVATRGYTCQGNEFSLFMLFAGNFILNKCPQVSEPHSIKILVPGAGLGRLAWEVATRGYTCQGNEFSLFMLFAGNFILNKCPQVSEPHSIKILVPGAGLGRLAWEVATRGYTCQGNEFSLFMLFAGNFILNKCPQVSEPHSIKILVPGAGLLRLAWEVATRGYTCQGNEFSLFMLFAGNFILNKCPQVNKYSVHPWLHQYVNNVTCEHQLVSASIPDVLPSTDCSESNFSMAAGDFLKVYTTPNEWNCVATCFFIDCAPNVIEFIESIYNILVPGGVWINLGPLLYHYSDLTTEDSIEPPYDILLDIIKDVGFIILKEKTGVKTKYAQNPNSMLQHEYDSVFFVCQKPAQ